MIFTGIARTFSLEGEKQYETIGQFWDEMSEIYGLENLRGLGYNWQDGKISYAIGLKNGKIEGCNLEINLPNDGWLYASGRTDNLKATYDEIYKDGSLSLEIEEFYEDGSFKISYYRKQR